MPNKCLKCGKPAALRCPKCSELGLPDAFFCSQGCFKASWNEHKKLHQEMLHMIQDFINEKKTTLRSVPDSIKKPDYAITGIPKGEHEIRGNGKPKVNSPEEIEKMRISGRLAREVLDEATAAVKPGVTTDEIDRIVHNATIARDAYPSPLNYCNFPKSVCTSVNEVICHGIPSRKELQEGDICNIDVTIFHNGYHGDVNETIPVGNIDEKSKQLIKAAFDAMEIGASVCRPGTAFCEIGNNIEKFIKKQKFSVVRDYTGHGISDLFHSEPSVCHYAHSRYKGEMAKGNIFTIEPMINAGGYQCEVLSDDWTVVTSDGSRSAQFENTYLVTDDGLENLTKRTEKSYKFWWM